MKLKDSLVDYKEGKFINGNYESEQDIKDALSEEKIFIFETSEMLELDKPPALKTVIDEIFTQ
ncbi:MAG TPA: hypothetical protein ENI29_08300 [bacterium]|nr:hypothetical protein [bacterium]